MSVLALNKGTALTISPPPPDVKLIKDILNANGHVGVNGGVQRGDAGIAREDEEKKESDADVMPLIPSRTSSGNSVVLARGSSTVRSPSSSKKNRSVE